MIEKYTKKIEKLFNQYGNPENINDLFNLTENEYIIIDAFYESYKIGLLKQTIALSGKYPQAKVTYKNDIDKLIDEINQTKDIEKIKVIYIPNEINNLEHLNKLKKTYPNKEIIIFWNSELAFIDDVISAVYMIEYYKSVIDDDMSPLEKVTMAYDMVKSNYYKEYKKKYTTKSMYITEMVNNDYIVCVGYTNIFNKILKDIGINSLLLDLSIKDIRHAGSIVKIKDDKYNIDDYFVFDPTWDASSVNHYLKFNKKEARYSKEKKDGYKKADDLSSYSHFLIPLNNYELHFPSSSDESLKISITEKIDDDITYKTLHTNQEKERNIPLSTYSFVLLLNKIKTAEGYNKDNIPNIIQEALYISDYGYYTLDAIKEVITSKKEKIKKYLKKIKDTINNKE